MKRTFQRAWIRMLRWFGYPGIAGVALLVPAIALAAWLPHLKEDASRATTSLADQARVAARRLRAVPRTVSEADVTQSFVAGFPLIAQNANDLDAIFAAAKEHQVTLVKGEYQLKVEPNAPFLTYTATFPIRNDYATLKDFSADVLTALPHVAMDELRMTREAAGATSLDAVVRFTLFYRRP